MERTLRCVVTFSDVPKSSQRDVPFHPTRPFPVATLTSTQEKSVNDDGNLRSRNFLTQMKSLVASIREI